MPDLTEWLFHKSVALHIPLSVHIDLTMRCNERCVHCYRVIEDRPELTTDELKGLLDDVARAGTLYLTFSGGEVFLRKDLFELVEHARRLHFDMRLKSNALLITPEKAARLRAPAGAGGVGARRHAHRSRRGAVRCRAQRLLHQRVWGRDALRRHADRVWQRT